MPVAVLCGGKCAWGAKQVNAKRSTLLWSIWLAIAVAAPAATAADEPLYHLSKSVALGAPDRWDYVVFDPPTRRVYVAHGDRLTVVNGDDGSITGEVPGFPGGTHGTALIAQLGLGFTDDGRAGEAAAFDLRTLTPHEHFKVGADADAAVYDPASGHVFVINGDSGSVSVIDPRQEKVIDTIHIGEGLETAVADGHGKLFVNGEEKSELVRIDTKTNKVDARWPIADCRRPHGLAMDTEHRRLFPSCVNDVLLVVDADSGTVIAKLPIGSGTDAAAYDPRRHLVFSSNGHDGTLSVIRQNDANSYEPLASIATSITARTMAIDPQSGRIYLAAAQIQPQAAGEPAPPHPAVIPGSLQLLFFDPRP
jgi:YVTN family beta-propeller protein